MGDHAPPESVVDELLRPADWDERLFAAAAEPLWRAFADAADAEYQATSKAMARLGKAKASTASDAASRYGVPPDDIALEMPQWMIDAGRDALQETFSQPYWQKVTTTTRDYIASVIREAVSNGLSAKETAALISDLEPAYSAARAMNVARTESGGALNAGHVSGIRQIGVETGERMGKEWISVHGSTTRPTHAAADGQEVEVDADFVVGESKAPWPGHWSLPAKERCNCACTIVSTILITAISEQQPGE